MYEKSYRDNVLKSVEKGNPKDNSFSWRKALITVVVLVIIALITLLIRLPYFQVKEIKINGSNSVFPEDVENLVKANIEGDYLFIYPKKSLFLISDIKLRKEIKNNFSRFKDVRVKRVANDTLSIVVKEYQPKYLWCEDGNNCSFMDEKGVVFSEAPFFSGAPFVKIFVGQKSEYPFVPIGTDELQIVEKLNQKLQNIRITISELHFKRDANNKLIVVFYHNDHRSEIFFDTKIAIDMSLDAFYATTRVQEFSRQYRDKTKKLLYVDLMLPGKVVYKFE